MAVPLERIVELWQTPLPITKVAEEVGLSRQRVSQRLIEAGYDPASRRQTDLRAASAKATAYQEQRIRTTKARAAQREKVLDAFDAMAERLGVQPWTLSQYVMKEGTYATARPGTSKTAGMYGKGKLPPRRTPEGDGIAAEAKSLCAPWSVRRVGEVCSRRVRARA